MRWSLFAGFVHPIRRYSIGIKGAGLGRLPAPSWKWAPLPDRVLLRMRGPDAIPFLQGLLTNDIRYLEDAIPQRQDALYALMLNNSGRILYDLLVYNCSEHGKEPDLLLECDRGRFKGLGNVLLKYRMRKQVTLDGCTESLAVYAVFPSFGVGSDPMERDLSEQILTSVVQMSAARQHLVWCTDPRLSFLGARLILPSLEPPEYFLANYEKSEPDEYRVTRYALGVAEGPQELLPEKSLPLESNGDYLNGISFHKGCYVGQELTARSHHTGVVRKRLMPLKFAESGAVDGLEAGADIVNEVGKSVGKFRKAERWIGLGLMRIEEALAASELTVQIGSRRVSCVTWKPQWWHQSPLAGEVRGFQPQESTSPQPS